MPLLIRSEVAKNKSDSNRPDCIGSSLVIVFIQLNRFLLLTHFSCKFPCITYTRKHDLDSENLSMPIIFTLINNIAKAMLCNNSISVLEYPGCGCKLKKEGVAGMQSLSKYNWAIFLTLLCMLAYLYTLNLKKDVCIFCVFRFGNAMP